MEETNKEGDDPILPKARTAARPSKKKQTGTSPKTPVKRERGRPKKTSDEKGGYNHVLFKTNLFKPVQLESVPLTDEQKQQRTTVYLNKIREIVQEEAASEYYWRLVFTATFHLYRSRKQAAAMAAGATKPPSVLPSDMAEDAGMEYFNLKNLFLGRGTAKNVFWFLRFLHEQSIDFNQVQYNENIIDRAYTFLTVLRQDDMNPEEVKQLFYK